jgi:hypothetical protein
MVRVVSTGDAAAATACDAEERRRGATGRRRAVWRRGGGGAAEWLRAVRRRGGGGAVEWRRALRWGGARQSGGGRVEMGRDREKREACGGGRRSGERTCEEGEADAQRMTHQVFVSLPYFLGAEIEITPHY